MKLVVFGLDQRLGYLRDNQVIDVSSAFLGYFCANAITSAIPVAKPSARRRPI